MDTVLQRILKIQVDLKFKRRIQINTNLQIQIRCNKQTPINIKRRIQVSISHQTTIPALVRGLILHQVILEENQLVDHLEEVLPLQVKRIRNE